MSIFLVSANEIFIFQIFYKIIKRKIQHYFFVILIFKIIIIENSAYLIIFNFSDRYLIKKIKIIQFSLSRGCKITNHKK